MSGDAKKKRSVDERTKGLFFFSLHAHFGVSECTRIFFLLLYYVNTYITCESDRHTRTHMHTDTRTHTGQDRGKCDEKSRDDETRDGDRVRVKGRGRGESVIIRNLTTQYRV